MYLNYTSLISAVSLLVAASASADIIWSGEQNLSGDDQYIDINSDSLVDAVIVYGAMGNPDGQAGYLRAYVETFDIYGANRVLVDSLYGYHAFLPYGTLISSAPDPSYDWGGGMFFTGTISEWSTFTSPPSDWSGLLGEVGNAYVGIEFETESSTHYGWINIALGEEGYLGFEDPIVTSWAYESTPGAGIVAGAIPEPSTGVLALVGAAALLLARRRFR